jgi:hypothetical protein
VMALQFYPITEARRAETSAVLAGRRAADGQRRADARPESKEVGFGRTVVLCDCSPTSHQTHAAMRCLCL